MRNRSYGLAIVSLLALAPLVGAQGEQATSLETYLSPGQIDAMGLDGLAPAQRATLLKWLDEQGVQPRASPAPAPEPAIVNAPPAAPRPAEAVVPVPATSATPPTASSDANFGKTVEQKRQMSTRILGSFSGWQGDTVFTLENGQVWKQRSDTRWETDMVDPEVVISRHFLGLHRLEVVGTGRSVGVSRVQ